MKKRPLLLMLTLILSLSFATSALANNNEQVKKSVARVLVIQEVVTNDQSNAYQIISTGSAFAIGRANEDPSYFVTNYHVIAPKESVTDDNGNVIPCTSISRYIYLVFDDVDSRKPANVVCASNTPDMAVLKLADPTKLRVPIRLRPFETLDSTERVYTVGFPGASDSYLNAQSQGMLYSRYKDMTIGAGLVSRLIDAGTSTEGELIQTNADINHGNSGGPLVDENGNVLGVNTFGITVENGQLVQGIYFAVSINEVIKMLKYQNIPYMLAGEGMSEWLILLLALIGVVAILLAALLILRSKTGAKRPSVAPTPAEDTAQRHLTGVEGVLQGRRYPVSGRVNIGRNPRYCGILFPPNTPGVSGLHCTVSFDGERVTVLDQGSKCGTYISGHRLQKGVPTVLHRGQTLQIGSKGQGLTLQS